MVHTSGGAISRTLATAGVSTAAALDVAAVMIAVVVAASAVLVVRARRGALSARAASITALIFEHSPSGMALSDAAGRLRAVNPTLARWCAATPPAMVGRYLGDLVEPDDRAALAAALRADPASPASVEVRLIAAGGIRWVRLRIAHLPAAGGEAALCVVQVEDAGEHRATTQRLAYDAAHDALTGLPNRRALSAELEAVLAEPGRGGALVMVDLDGFKAVNDRLGHAGGDEVLRVVAARLRSCLRPGDVAGRLGGDEMLVIARGVLDEAGAQAVGQRVLAAVVGPAGLRAGTAVVRASIGVRRITAADGEAAAVLREVDAALYRAKAAGGCCVRRATPAHSHSHSRGATVSLPTRARQVA